MSRGERWMVIAVGALFAAVGAWLIFARPEPYAPSAVDAAGIPADAGVDG